MYSEEQLRKGVQDLFTGRYPRRPPEPELLEAISGNSRKMRRYELKFRKFNDEDAKLIAKALTTNTSLHELDLSDNQIGDEGVEALTAALIDNDSLRYLHLDNNRVKDRGATALDNLLKYNTGLIDVYLDEKINPEIRRSISHQTDINHKGYHVYKKQIKKLSIYLLFIFMNSPVFNELPIELYVLILANIHSTLIPQPPKHRLDSRCDETNKELISTNQYVGYEFASKLSMSWVFTSTIDISTLVKDAEEYQKENPNKLSIQALLPALHEIKKGTNITNLDKYLHSIQNNFPNEFNYDIALQGLFHQTKKVPISASTSAECTELSFKVVEDTANDDNPKPPSECGREKRGNCSIR